MEERNNATVQELMAQMETILAMYKAQKRHVGTSNAQSTQPTQTLDTLPNTTGVEILPGNIHKVTTHWTNGRRKVNPKEENIKATITDYDILAYADVQQGKTNKADGDQFRNECKVCPKCKKPCARTFTMCNNCQSQLHQKTDHTPNVFTGYMYGIEQIDNKKDKPLYLKMSVRHQSEEVLVCDDLGLALSPCHMLAIPMNRYIPDWRFLLRCPSFGLRILKQLEERAWDCAQTHLQNENNAKLFGSPTVPLSEDDLLMGLNYPPSLSQLHVQCILAPMLPHEYSKCIYEGHYTYNRFFPIEYVKNILALGERMDVTIDTHIEHIIEKFRTRVDYDSILAKFIQNVHYRQNLRGVWNADKFKTTIEAHQKPNFTDEEKKLIDEDKQFLTNHNTDGVSYYKYAKTQPVPSWITDKGIAIDIRNNATTFVPANGLTIVQEWAHNRLVTLRDATFCPSHALAYTILMNIKLHEPEFHESEHMSKHVMHLFQIFWACADRNEDVGKIRMGITYRPEQLDTWKGSFPFVIPVKWLLENQETNKFVKKDQEQVAWINGAGSLGQKVTLQNGVIKVDFRMPGILIIGERSDFIDVTHGPIPLTEAYLTHNNQNITSNEPSNPSPIIAYLDKCIQKYTEEYKKLSEDKQTKSKTFLTFITNVRAILKNTTDTTCTFILDYGIPVRCASIIHNNLDAEVKWRQDKFPLYVKTSAGWGKPNHLHRLSLCNTFAQLSNAVKHMRTEDGSLPDPFQEMEWSKNGVETKNESSEYRGVVITLQGVRTDHVHHIWSSSEKKPIKDKMVPFFKEANVESLTWSIEELATNPIEVHGLVTTLLSLGAR